mgnify:CR=1 FL=1
MNHHHSAIHNYHYIGQFTVYNVTNPAVPIKLTTVINNAINTADSLHNNINRTTISYANGTATGALALYIHDSNNVILELNDYLSSFNRINIYASSHRVHNSVASLDGTAIYQAKSLYIYNSNTHNKPQQFTMLFPNAAKHINNIVIDKGVEANMLFTEIMHNTSIQMLNENSRLEFDVDHIMYSNNLHYTGKNNTIATKWIAAISHWHIKPITCYNATTLEITDPINKNGKFSISDLIDTSSRYNNITDIILDDAIQSDGHIINIPTEATIHIGNPHSPPDIPFNITHEIIYNTESRGQFHYCIHNLVDAHTEQNIILGANVEQINLHLSPALLNSTINISHQSNSAANITVDGGKINTTYDLYYHTPLGDHHDMILKENYCLGEINIYQI